LKDFTAALAFFGTPHRGGNGVAFGKLVVNVASAITGEVKNPLLSILSKDSSQLEDITRNFRSQLEDYHFLSFFETKKMKKPNSALRFIQMVFTPTLYSSSVEGTNICVDSS
jgi:hypothetical protein